ncbi:putative transmembrane protein 217B isoform 2-T3 [Thomomys bottae]
MNARMVSLVAAVFSIFNTVQFLIIELNQSMHIGYEEKYSLYLSTSSEFVTKLMVYKKTLNTSLTLTTVFMGCLLLYCTLRSQFLGPLIYTLWIVAYELINFSLILLIQGLVKEQFRQLGYLHMVFQVSRMCLHFCCLPFIVKHGYFLFKEPKMVGKLGRHRHSSASTVDLWTPVGLGMIYRKLQ